MNKGFAKTFHAGGAVTELRVVKFDGSGNVVQATAGTDNVIGIADFKNTVVSGDRIDVNMGGQPEATAGAAIAAGAAVASNADGKVVTAVANDVAIGFAVNGADADGDIITVQINRHKV